MAEYLVVTGKFGGIGTHIVHVRPDWASERCPTPATVWDIGQDGEEHRPAGPVGPHVVQYFSNGVRRGIVQILLVVLYPSGEDAGMGEKELLAAYLRFIRELKGIRLFPDEPLDLRPTYVVIPAAAPPLR